MSDNIHERLAEDLEKAFDPTLTAQEFPNAQDPDQANDTEQSSTKALHSLLLNFMGIMTSYIQEWGSENVLIALPAEWARIPVLFDPNNDSPFSFVTERSLIVSASREGVVCARFEAKLDHYLHDLTRLIEHSTDRGRNLEENDDKQ
jgi:hypothetical protein